MVKKLERVQPPSEEPVSLEEVKKHLNVDYIHDDNLIMSYIVAAREYAEEYTRRSFVTQTWKAYGYDIQALPRPPVQEILLVADGCITYRAGYGSAQDVPGPIKMAIKAMVSDLYDGQSFGPGHELAHRLLATYRVMRI